VREIATIAAGTFDHYICRRDDGLRGRGPTEIPEMLRDALLAAGVEEDSIEVVAEETEATDRVLQMAAAGDLVLVFGDDIKRTWKQIEDFAGGSAGEAVDSAPPAPMVELPELPDAFLEEGESLIRDERGVRIARVEEEAD
jgi:cyanophycin synthetase